MSALLLVLLLDVPRPPPEKPRAPAVNACTSDSDCVLTTQVGCCPSPCPTVYATTRTAETERVRRCSVVDVMCASTEQKKCAAPEPMSAFRAQCVEGSCEARHVGAVPTPMPPPPPSANECQSDSECTVVNVPPPPSAACHQSGCCCPTPQAMPVSQQPRALSEPAPQFGLKAGNCACPTPMRRQATCQRGKCMFAPVRPHPVG